MDEIARKNPETCQNITYATEDELYKHKRKLYPKATNNSGDGYSQFFDDATKLAILKKIKIAKAKKKNKK